MTQSQIDASRRNGAKSHGPITAEGKAIASGNSLRHGCTAKAILLTSESPQAFFELTAGYYDKFQPKDDVERDVMDEVVINKWRQRRDWSNETALLELEMDKQTKKVASEYKNIDHACEFALAFRALADESKSLALAARYETGHRRAYYNALNAFLKLRSAFKPEFAQTAPEPEIGNCETNPATNNPPPPQQHTPTSSTSQPPAPSPRPAHEEPASPVEQTSRPVSTPDATGKTPRNPDGSSKLR